MRIFGTIYFLWEMLPHYVLRCIFQLKYLTFDILLENCQGPWAKVARRCQRLLLTAGVGNAQPGESYIFRWSFADSELWPCYIDPVLHCSEKGKRRKGFWKQNLIFSSLLVRSTSWTSSSLLRVSEIQTIQYLGARPKHLSTSAHTLRHLGIEVSFK